MQVGAVMSGGDVLQVAFSVVVEDYPLRFSTSRESSVSSRTRSRHEEATCFAPIVLQKNLFHGDALEHGPHK